jgi:hypothetical protein
MTAVQTSTALYQLFILNNGKLWCSTVPVADLNMEQDTCPVFIVSSKFITHFVCMLIIPNNTAIKNMNH